MTGSLPSPRACCSLACIALLGASIGACTVSRSSSQANGDGGGTGNDGGRVLIDSNLPPSDATCEAIALHAQPGTANVLVVLDRSSSMYREPGLGLPGVDRWNPAIQAVQAVTTALQDRVQFGLMLFADPDAAAGMTLCGAGKIDVAPMLVSASAIAGHLTGDPNTLTGSWTPTATSLDAARTALSTLEGRSYVLLITDGAPNCNSALNGATCRCGSDTMSCSTNPRLCIDSDRTVASVAALASAGIPTYVVGYDTSAWADVLDAMAAAGGTEYTTHIPVGDEASLEGAIEAIAGSVVSCNVDLDGPPDAVSYVHVTLDGVDVPHATPTATGGTWQLTGDRTVELLGDACATLRDGASHDLHITRECHPLF